MTLPPLIKNFQIPKNNNGSHNQSSDIANFKKGTTTMGFKFKDGIILAVDSRASMGSFISSE